ncbi:zona pellucida sperm-binding protein 4-like [Nerophis ophidion]|uniref:zona pellucida sperm-binding protein 4-like n=1 Tax=Nerophis ophidion TaxID=159077 RepID=UPI002ADF51AC|nr:zona pellucida sperm-binding protein 4-like [Nerophis ophidion]
MIVVVAREVTLPNINLESISFNENGLGCSTVDTTSAFAIYQFPITACGTAVTEEAPDVVIYENWMSASYEVAIGLRGAITRDSQYQCTSTATHLFVSRQPKTPVIPGASGSSGTLAVPLSKRPMSRRALWLPVWRFSILRGTEVWSRTTTNICSLFEININEKARHKVINIANSWKKLGLAGGGATLRRVR